MTLLEVKNLSFVVKERTILHDVSFRLEAGQWLGILGPNGAGKTTLIKCLNNSVNYLGKIYYIDKNSKSFKHKQRARFISTLSQITNISYSYTVKDIVELGLYSCEDYIKNSTNHTVEKVLKQIGLDEFANRSVLSLSGGEIQRVFFAQAILQNPKVMILDEPTNHLDLKYQKLFFDGIKSWIKQNNTAVISILHDIHIASKYTDHVLFLKSGEKFAFGCTNELMTNENLSNLFDVDIVKLYK